MHCSRGWRKPFSKRWTHWQSSLLCGRPLALTSQGAEGPWCEGKARTPGGCARQACRASECPHLALTDTALYGPCSFPPHTVTALVCRTPLPFTPLSLSLTGEGEAELFPGESLLWVNSLWSPPPSPPAGQGLPGIGHHPLSVGGGRGSPSYSPL